MLNIIIFLFLSFLDRGIYCMIGIQNFYSFDQVFESSHDVDIKYLSRVTMLISSIDCVGFV